MDVSVIQALYKQACDVVRASGTLEKWQDRTGLSKNTIQKIRNGEESHRAQSMMQIIDAVLMNEQGLEYALWAEAMGMQEQEHELLRRYTGTFRYVRCSTQGEVTSGDVVLRDMINHVAFDHIPEFDGDMNNNVDGHVLHSGYVFLLGKRLTFVGVGDRYLRLMTAVDHDTPADAVMTGIVLTPDGDRRMPMSSIFFMAHESYAKYASFEDEYRETYHEKVQVSQGNEVLGLLTL